jgi:predicted enzyme related to lactoylglutathione lyase
MIKRSDLAWITVSDINKAKKFFTEVLGLELRADTPEYGWIELMPKEGGCALGVGQSNPEGDDVKPGSNAILTFTVDDINAMKAVLEKNNVTILGDIVEVPGHVKMLFFSDLDGNKFQIVQMIESAHGKSCC